MAEQDEPQHNPSPPADSDGQVLVVEDDPEINELVGAYVEIAGFQFLG